MCRLSHALCLVCLAVLRWLSCALCLVCWLSCALCLVCRPAVLCPLSRVPAVMCLLPRASCLLCPLPCVLAGCLVPSALCAGWLSCALCLMCFLELVCGFIMQDNLNYFSNGCTVELGVLQPVILFRISRGGSIHRVYVFKG